MDKEKEIYYLKEGEVELDEEDDYNYKEINVLEDPAILSSDGEEDYDTALRQIELTKAIQYEEETVVKEKFKPVGSGNIEVIDDFVRNFLVSMGLQQTAHCFQTEWYELSITGQLSDQYQHNVPDVYAQNQILQQKVEDLWTQLNDNKEIAKRAKEKYIRLRKERDYHQMHHRRVLQEKEKLLADIKRMKDHFASYDPMLKDLRNKYETATREKLLTSLERDKAIAEVECLQSTLQSLRPLSYPQSKSNKPLPPINTQTAVQSDFKMLSSAPANPYHCSSSLPSCAHLTRVGGFQLTGTIAAHDYAISCITLHPTKNIVATGSDDHTWKVWVVPSGELLMTGEGHDDWVSSVQFHPNGELLASTSGDGTVKVWNLSQSTATFTLSDHRQPVWKCSWNWSGQILGSAGMDHCCRLWDVDSGHCVLALRGHTDSVNAVQFLPYSNTVATCSADKTVAIWDIRTGLCTQTFYDHQNACNDVVANYQVTELYSADCFGVVIKWDLRNSKCGDYHWDLGPFPVNGLAIDPAGSVLACASGSDKICLVELESNQVANLEINGSVEGVCYGHKAEILYSVGSNGNIAVWQ